MGADKKPDSPWHDFLPKLIIAVLSVAVGASIAGVFSCFITDKFQREAQERSNDIALSKLIVDILDKENPNLHLSLPPLVGTVKDSTTRYAMNLAIKANNKVSETIKQEVDSSARNPTQITTRNESTEDSSHRLADYITSKGTILKIMWLKTDAISEGKAKEIKRLFENEYEVRMYPAPPSEYLSRLGGVNIVPQEAVSEILTTTEDERSQADYIRKTIAQKSDLGEPTITLNGNFKDDTIVVVLPNKIPPAQNH